MNNEGTGTLMGHLLCYTERELLCFGRFTGGGNNADREEK